MKEQWRKEMQRKLADYRRPAPELPWEEMQLRIAAQKKPVGFVFTRAKRMAAAAALALLLAGTAFVVLQKDGGDAHKALATHAKKTVNDAPNYKDNQTIEDAQTHLSHLSSDASATVLCASAERKPSRMVAPIEKGSGNINESTEQNAAATSPEVAQNIASSPAENKQTAPHSVITTPVGTHPLKPEMTRVAKRATTIGNLTAGVFMSNVMASNDQTRISGPALAKAEPIGDYDHTMIGTVGSVVTENLSDIKTEVRHRQPVRFGASLRYRFNDKWSVQGGLSYTMLSSTLVRELQSYSLETDQHLTYLGIPLSVNYRIWGNRHFGVYASAGGTIEKMIHGRRKMSYVIKGTTESVDRTKVHIKELQYALNGSMGVEYNLDRHFSVYAEPGLSYYFANPSDIPTIYKEKPLNFNLNLGVRFNLK